MLRPEYLAQKLTPYPLPTKDGGVLRTIGDAHAYMMALPKKRPSCRRSLPDEPTNAHSLLHDRKPASVHVHLPRRCFGRRSYFLCDQLLRHFPPRSDLD